MLIPLVTAAFAAFIQTAQVAPSQTVAAATRDAPVPRERSAPDSLRALRTARRAQNSFEFIRRQYMPHEYGVGSHHCDVQVGRWCVWNDESNDRKAPAEAPRVIEARVKLLAVLDSVGAQFPGDEWVAAQQVRYLIEQRRYADAVRVANRCTASGSAYRCETFAAVALHDSGAVHAADSTFTLALSAMPDSVRCRWTDISFLIDDELADHYHKADCEGRRALEAEFFRLTNPLYLREYDFRNEFLARVARTDMMQESRTPMGSPRESAFLETALRYGYDTWFVRGDPPIGSMGEAPVAGYREGGPGFNFVPSYDVFPSPAALTPDDWDLSLRSARTIYAPPYARRFRPLEHEQIALFRRGDSAIVVAAYDVSKDTLFRPDTLEAGIFTAAVEGSRIAEPHGLVKVLASPTGVLKTTAPWSPMIVSLELLDDSTHSATRLRYGVTPPLDVGRVSVSDLLMFAPTGGDASPATLAEVTPLMLHDLHVSATEPLGVFWETYGVRPSGESVEVSLTIDRIQEGWARRAAERLHLATPFSPVRVKWQELPSQADHVASRTMTLDLSKLDRGRYEIRLTVSPHGEPSVVSKREIFIDK
jgi:hypothetical protein